MEKTEEDDLFAALREELCGKAYYHGQKGRGTIKAACEGRCMIAYPGGETELLTVGQMYDRRRILRAAPNRTAVQGKLQTAIPPAGQTVPSPAMQWMKMASITRLRRLKWLEIA